MDAALKRTRTDSAWRTSSTAIVQLSSTGTSTCRGCHDKIDYNVLRLGISYQHREGFMLMEWFHMDCTPPSIRIEEVCVIEANMKQGIAQQVRKWIEYRKNKTEEIPATEDLSESFCDCRITSSTKLSPFVK